MYLKLMLIPLLLLLLKKDCQAKRETRVPPPEKEVVIVGQKTKHGNRNYRSIQETRPTVEIVPSESSPGPEAEPPQEDDLTLRQVRLALALKEMEDLKIKEDIFWRQYDIVKDRILNGAEVEQEYKLESVTDNDLTPVESQHLILGDHNTFLQRKRWKRSVGKNRGLRALHTMYEEKKSCGNFKCKPSYVPLE